MPGHLGPYLSGQSKTSVTAPSVTGPLYDEAMVSSVLAETTQGSYPIEVTKFGDVARKFVWVDSPAEKARKARGYLDSLRASKGCLPDVDWRGQRDRLLAHAFSPTCTCVDCMRVTTVLRSNRYGPPTQPLSTRSAIINNALDAVAQSSSTRLFEAVYAQEKTLVNLYQRKTITMGDIEHFRLQANRFLKRRTGMMIHGWPI